VWLCVAFVGGLQCVGDDAADLARTVSCLLHCLPLLHAGNAPAKAAYLAALPAVLRRCTDAGRCLADCQQLLSYALIHPAISGDELAPLSGAWQQQRSAAPPRALIADQLGAPEHLLVNGPSAPEPPAALLSNGGGVGVTAGHRDLGAARSLPVGLLLPHHDVNNSTSLRVSRAGGGGGAGSLQHSSPPPGLLPRALTPPRLSE